MSNSCCSDGEIDIPSGTRCRLVRNNCKLAVIHYKQYIRIFESYHLISNNSSTIFSLLWGGYISRIYPESTQELNQILGPFWSVYKAESPQDLKKSVNKPELTQKVPRKSFKFWALSGLFALF